MEKKLRIRFCLIVQLIAMLMLALPVGAQKRDLHELFQQGAAKGVQATPNATDIIEVDLSEWESDYDTPIVVATGLKYRFTNGVVRKKNDGSWQGGPLFEIAKGSNVYLSSGASFDGGGFHTNDDVVLIKDGAFCLEGGSVTGVYGWENPTVNSNGDTAVRLQDVENPVISPCLVVLSGTIAGRVDNNTTTGIVSLSGGVVTRLSTARDILMYGNAQILTNLYFYDQTAKVHLRSPLQYNLRFSNYKKDQMVVSPADYNVTESDLSKMSLGGSNASQYILSLENACIYVREQGPKRNIDDLEPGTLPDRITDPDNVEELTITGKLNGTDIKIIRSMANTSLKKLDISGCSIVSGGEEYLEEGYVLSENEKTAYGLGVSFVYSGATRNDTIGTYMFAGLSKLESLILPNSVTTVNEHAFIKSPLLKYITFGSSVNKFTTGFLFFGSNSIEEISFNGNDNFVSDKIAIYDSDKRTLIAVAPSYSGTYSISNTVDSIAPYAFAGCMNRSVTIPSRLTHINAYAFCQSGLQDVVIPSTVTSIGEGAFFYCENLSSVTFGENVESIGYGAFAHCALKEVDLSMTKIKTLEGDKHKGMFSLFVKVGAFESTEINIVKLPETLLGIGGKVFTSNSLMDIYSSAITPPVITFGYYTAPRVHSGVLYDSVGESASFYNVDTLTCRVHIPRGTLAAYKTTVWNKFKNIIQDLPNDNFDPNYITDAEWLQQRLDEIAEENPSEPVTLTIWDEGITLSECLYFKSGCKVILTGGQLTFNIFKEAFWIDSATDVTLQDISIDLNNQWSFECFFNKGKLTIGPKVIYKNINTTSGSGNTVFYNNYTDGVLNIYSGDVETPGTVIENEGTVIIRGDVKFRTTGQNPVYSNNKYINGGNDVLYMYAGTLSSEGNIVMSATQIHMRGGTIMGGDNCTLIDATTFWIYSEDKINIPTLQGGENSTLIAERTKCYISGGNLIGGRTYGNGSIGRDGVPEGYPTFTLTSNRIDVTTESRICWWYGQLPEIYMGKDAVLSNVLLPNHITINGDWKNMANGHVLIKGIEKTVFDCINFIGFPYSDGRWFVEYEAANKQAKLHKMTLQEWLEEQNKGDEDKGTEDDPVAIDFPDYDNENGDLWEGDDMGFGTPDGHIKVHYWWRDLDWIIGYDGWPTRPSLRLMTNIWIYKGSSLRWSHFYLSGQNSSKYVYVYGTLIIDIDVYIRFFNYRFIHVMPGGRVIIRGGRMHTVGHLIYNEGGMVMYEDGDGLYTGQDYGIVNTESGTISISGGTVSGGVYSHGKGTISISGGFISHGKGIAVGNSGGGRINISGGTICGYYPRTGVGGYDTPDVDNVNGTLWITGGTIGAKGEGIIRTYGDLWIDGKARFGEVWMHRNARIHIISKLTVLLRFHFFIVGEFDIDVPIFIGSEGYRLTEEDLKLIDVDLPEGYRLKLVDGNIIITNKGWLPDLFKFPRPDGEDPNKGKDPNDPYNPEIPNGVDIDEDYTLPDLHILFGSADGSKKSGPMVMENATLRINSASTTFSHIEVHGEGDAHIETQGKMVVGEGTTVSGFQRFVQVLHGGSLIWQGGVTSDVAEVIDNDGGTLELKNGKIGGIVRSNTDITANGSVEVEEFVMTSGKSINVTGKLTTKWDVRIVTESGDDISAETVDENKAILKSTDGYSLTLEDMEHITVNLPEDYVLTYDATEKAVYIKKASEVGVRQVRDASGDGTFSIYSASGSLQKQNATTTDGLTKGMYIVNGRKVVVK